MVEMGSQWCHWVAHGTPNVPKWNQKSIPKPEYRDTRVLAWSNGTNEEAKAPQKPPKQSQHDTRRMPPGPQRPPKPSQHNEKEHRMNATGPLQRTHGLQMASE